MAVVAAPARTAPAPPSPPGSSAPASAPLRPDTAWLRPGHGARLGLRAAAMEEEEEDPELER